jgi:D-3-phosphoglycerate dehydrogenase
MPSNRKKVMVPHTMGKEGVSLLQARDDIEVQVYPADIKQSDLLPMLSDVAGIALSGTPYKQTEMAASPVMEVVARIGVGYDAVEVPALTARRVPLMVAGTANSTSVAEHAFHLMMALAKRSTALDGLWTGAQRHLGGSPRRPANGTVGQDSAHRRLRPHRYPFGAPLPGLRHDRADL